jgi:hypothetical protein
MSIVYILSLVNWLSIFLVIHILDSRRLLLTVNNGAHKYLRKCEITINNELEYADSPWFKFLIFD